MELPPPVMPLTGAPSRAWSDACNFPNMSPMSASEEQLQLFRQYVTRTCKDDGVEVLVRVPKDIAAGTVSKQYGLMWSFCGGGFTTGHPNFAAWAMTHLTPLYGALPTIIAIPYPMLPEHSAKEAHSYMDKVLAFISTGRLADWMAKEFQAMTATLDLADGLCEGVSAGCYWAFYAYIQLDRTGVRFKVMRWLYPMISSYSRTCDQEYRGQVIPEDKLRKVAHQCFREAANHRPAKTLHIGRTPPKGMGNLPLTATRVRASINGHQPEWTPPWIVLWQGPSIMDIIESWQISDSPTARSHISNPGKDDERVVQIDAGEINTMLSDKLGNLGLTYNADINALQFKVDEHTLLQPSYLPFMTSSHGDNDKNCPIQDRNRAFNILHCVFGPDAEVRCRTVIGKSHGYDKYVGSEEEMTEILREMGWKNVVQGFVGEH